MNQYSILKMTRESGLLRGGDGWTMPHRWGITEIERFAAEMVRLQQNISIVWSKEDVDDLIKEMQS